MVELLIVLTVVGILSSIAVPKYSAIKRRATAAQIVGDFAVIRHAAMGFMSDSGYFPREAASGEIPANLSKYLPNNFAFKKAQWTLDYENWPFFESRVIGISFSTADPALAYAANRLLKTATMYNAGKYTVILSGL